MNLVLFSGPYVQRKYGEDGVFPCALGSVHTDLTQNGLFLVA